MSARNHSMTSAEIAEVMQKYAPGPRTDEQKNAASAALLRLAGDYEARRSRIGLIFVPRRVVWTDSPAAFRSEIRKLRKRFPDRHPNVIRPDTETMVHPSAIIGVSDGAVDWHTARSQLALLTRAGQAGRDVRVDVPWSWSRAAVNTLTIMRTETMYARRGCTEDQRLIMSFWESAHSVAAAGDAFVVLQLPLHVAMSENGRIHSTDGPAVTWPGGEVMYAVNDIVVTEWMLGQPALLAAMTSNNAEERADYIRSMDWDNLVAAAGMRQLDESPDPGNPGQLIRLWEIPPIVFGRRETVLECINGTPEDDGTTRRRYMLFTGSKPKTAMEAAATTYMMPAEYYAMMERRT